MVKAMGKSGHTYHKNALSANLCTQNYNSISNRKVDQTDLERFIYKQRADETDKRLQN